MLDRTLVETLIYIQTRDGLTNAQFATKIGIHEVSWCRIRNFKKGFGEKSLKGIRQAYPELKEAIDNYMTGDIGLLIIHGSPERHHDGKWRAFWDYCGRIYQRVLDVIYDWARR